MDAKLDFNPPGKLILRMPGRHFSDFPIFSIHGKNRTFPKKFPTVFVIHRIDKFIKILLAVKS